MVFTIEWPTGYMDLNIGKFFVEANKRQICKAMRLAKQYCDNNQRKELITEMNNEIKSRTVALDRCGELEFEREQILRPFLGLLAKRPLPPQEKRLTEQCDRLKWCVDLIENERWG